MMRIETAAERALSHPRILLVIVLLLVGTVAAGTMFLESETTFGDVGIGSDEEAALEEIEDRFGGVDEQRTYAQLVVDAEDALSKENLVSTLELQQAIRNNPDVAPTLTEDRPTRGLANLVAMAHAPGDGTPDLETQLRTIRDLSPAAIETTVAELLDGPRSEAALQYLPASFAPDRQTDSTMLVVAQELPSELSGNAMPDEIVTAQEAIRSEADEHELSIRVAGRGLLTAEMNQSTSDTFTLLGPLSLVFVLGILILAYRNLRDILLSLVGIVLVLLWTFGALGWLGIAFNPILIAIPVFLIGMAIDFGLHVVMRYRERAHEGTGGPTRSMATALAGVGLALVWVTTTTVIGFMSNLTSPMEPIRELGLMAAIGIVGAFVVFVGLVPAAKLVLDARFGGTDATRAIGTSSGGIGRALSSLASVSSRIPVIVLVIAVVLTAGATATAVGVDTTFDQSGNIADDPPAWAESLPEPFAPGEYRVEDAYATVDEQYLREGTTGELLLTGDVTEPAVLERLQQLHEAAASTDSVVTLANGQAAAQSPLTALEAAAERSAAFSETLTNADTDDDGLPDEQIAAIYDRLFDLAPEEAQAVLDSSANGYDAARVRVSVDGSAARGAVTEDLRSLATHLEGEDVSVTATGDPVVNHLIANELVDTVVVSLFVTLLVVAGLLMLVFRVVHGSASLGLVTMIPVTFGVAWIIATMDLLGYSLNVVTALTASLTIGIGIDYSIHVSERFRSELVDTDRTSSAIRTTLRGTGGALLGSAATTAVGFGILVFAINPTLQQFGLITGIMIGYSFLGAVVLLPALLAIWAKLATPVSTTMDASEEEPASPAD